jgi:hypothetical protein
MSEFTEKPPVRLPPASVLEESSPPRPSFWKTQGLTILVAAVVAGVVAAVAALLVTIGLSRFLASPKTQVVAGEASRPGTLHQEGAAVLRTEPVEVYYPVPYETPPNLVLEGPNSPNCVITEQKQDHFKAKTTINFGGVNVSWKAQGMPKAGGKK